MRAVAGLTALIGLMALAPAQEADPAIDAAIDRLVDPERGGAATDLLVGHGVAAVPALRAALHAWLEGRTEVSPRGVLWVIGRIGAAAHDLGLDLCRVLDRAVDARDAGLAAQAAWAIGEVAVAERSIALALNKRVSRYLTEWRDGPAALEIGFTASKTTLVARPDTPRQWSWLDAELDPAVGGELSIQDAALAWRLRRGGSGDVDFDAATVDALAQRWARTVAAAVEAERSTASARFAAEVAVALLLAGRGGDPGPLAAAAIGHFEPQLRLRALEALADRIGEASATWDTCRALRTGLADAYPPVRMAALRGWNALGGPVALVAAWLAVAEREPAQAEAAIARARRHARRLGRDAEVWIDVTLGERPLEALGWPGTGRAAPMLPEFCAGWTRLAGPAGWSGWSRLAAELVTREPRAWSRLWPAVVDGVAFVTDAELARRCEAIAGWAAADPEVDVDAVIVRLTAVVDAVDAIDLVPIATAIARLRLPPSTAIDALCAAARDPDPRVRLRAIRLLAGRGVRTAEMLAAVREGAGTGRPARIRVGGRSQFDIAGRIAIQEAAEPLLR